MMNTVLLLLIPRKKMFVTVLPLILGYLARRGCRDYWGMSEGNADSDKKEKREGVD